MKKHLNLITVKSLSASRRKVQQRAEILHSGSKVRRSLTKFLQPHCILKYFSSQLTPPPTFQNRCCYQELCSTQISFSSKLHQNQPLHFLLRLQLNKICNIWKAKSRSKLTDEKDRICSSTPGRNWITDVFHLRRCRHESPLFRLDLVGCRQRPDTYIFICPRMAELLLHNE